MEGWDAGDANRMEAALHPELAKRGETMKRERAKQIVLALVGLTYFALLYPLWGDLWHSHWLVGMKGNDCEPMFLSFLVGLGFFLLLAVRNPSAHRSLIVFAAWNALFHASVMAIETVEAWRQGVHRDYTDVVIFLVIGGVLLAIIPARAAAPVSSVAGQVQR
jgi:hypothetical protein